MSSNTTFATLRLLPELFPLIALHLPLYATPSSLLALALTNHGIYDIIHNLLYTRLILRNEKDALSMFQRILNEAGLGKVVRELHVMSELSVATRNGQTPFDTVTGLIKLIKSDSLPHIHTLTLHMSGDWRTDEKWNDIHGFGHLPLEFWDELGSRCPRLRSVVLSGMGDREHDPWLHKSGIYDLTGIKELTHLGLTFFPNEQVQHDGTDRILGNICYLSSSLHTLVLGFYFKYDSASPILSLDFPQLRSLTLASFSVPDTSEAMAFWGRHPWLEKLKLTDTERTSRWFSDAVEAELLPNLKHFEASFHDVCALRSVLPRLMGLSIQQSLNAQGPYLLRRLIPAGLPNLAGLEIDQTWSIDPDSLRRYEGSMWHESPDGKFHEEKKFRNAARNFTDNYIHSIVKGAPNIKELCLHGIPLHPVTMEKLAPQLAEFTKLERLYFRGVNDSERSLRTPANREAFYASSRVIAEKCKALERITDISHSPYLATKIRRNDAGGVEEAVPTRGYGMTIGSDNEAFPLNPHPFENPG